jgi:phenylglyoxylate dehydrogenase delta subunit
MIKPQAKAQFDPAGIPNNLCPTACERSEALMGDWRAFRPVVDRDNCVKCAVCWLYCPVQCIEERAAWFQADLSACKGCGICAQECPHRAIAMIEEPED